MKPNISAYVTNIYKAPLFRLNAHQHILSGYMYPCNIYVYIPYVSPAH